MSEPAQPPLRRFTPDQISVAVNALRPRLSSGLLLSPEVERLLVLRDLEGTDWAYGLRSGRWYRHRSGAWEEAQGPQKLEGIAALGGQMPLSPSSPPEEATVVSSAADAPNAAVAAASVVERLNRAYADGDLSTAEVSDLLEELVLVDGSGDLWALGFQSRRWYRLSDRQWVVGGGAPVAGGGDASVLTPEVATDALRRLEAAPSRFPESIASAWNPPAGYPERLSCSNCGGGLSTTAEACPFCGGPAPLSATEPTEAATRSAPVVGRSVGLPEQTSWHLALVIGEGAGQLFALRDGVRIGRGSENEIRLTDPRASSRHARIEAVGDGYRVVDLQSTNGTFLNDARISVPAVLKNGDRLGVGDSVLEIVAPSACPHCGAAISPGDVYCGECGRPLTAGTLHQPPPTAASPGAIPQTGLSEPASGVAARQHRPLWTWFAAGCAAVIVLLGIPALCLVALALLRGS